MHSSVLDPLLRRGGAVPEHLTLAGHQVGTGVVILWGTLLAAVALTGERTSWHVLRHVVTLAHEGGHALVAVLAGRRLAGIRLHSDTSGVTVSAGRPSGPGMVLTAMAGYPAPSLIGLCFAALLATGRVDPMLWACVGLLLLMLVQVRNAFGALSVLASGIGVAAVIWWATPWVSLVFGAAIGWLLLVGGLRAVVELQRTRRRGRSLTSDADQLARLTGLPGLFWVGAFLLTAIGCLLGAGRLLL